MENRDVDQPRSPQNQSRLEFTPHTAHAAAAASVPVDESYDTVRSQKDRCESAPDNRATEDTNQSSRGRTRADNCLGVAASEKRDPKSTNKWQSHDDCCPSESMYGVHNNWLGLQQTAAAATSCHRWLLLRCVAVLRWRGRLSEQMVYRLRPHGCSI